MCLIIPKYIKEVEDKIKDRLVEETIGEVKGLSVEIARKVLEDMDMVEVIFGEAIFEEEVILEVDIIIEWIEVWKIGEHGDNLGHMKEKEEIGHHLVLDWVQELVQIETGLGVSNCREYVHFANECPNLIPEDSDKESDSIRSVSLHLADSDTGFDMEHYLNI